MPTGSGRTTQPGTRGTPPRDVAQRTGTARIRGTITAADSGTCLRRAVVRLSAREMREGRTALTDAQGLYEFTELPAGRYSLSVSKGGFVSLQYGQRRPFEGGRPIEVREGERLSGVNVVLPRGSVITGRVVDEFGEPVADAYVSVMRYQFMRGRRRLLPAGRSSQTNDLGQYRIYGLAPGEYYVSASVRNMEFGPDTVTVGDVTGFAPTYFPAATNPAEAQRVPVALGQEAVADVTLVPSRLVKVSGTIVDSTGKPVQNGFIRLTTPGEFSPMGGGTGRIRESGAFTISSVPPGSYTLVASTRGGGPMRQGPAANDEAAEAASVPITVGNEDMEGVLVTTSKGGRATGQVIIESGIATVAPTAVRVTTYPIDDDMSGGFGFGGGPGFGEVKPDWTFELRSLFGRVGVAVSGTSGLQLKGVYVDGRDVTDTGFEVKPQQVIRGLEVVLTDKRTELSGAVTDARGQPVRDYTVVVFAEDDAKWGAVSNRYTRTARPDQDGRYLTTGLPPGEYLAVAIDYLDQETGGAQNPEVLLRLRDVATSVRLGEGEKKTLDLKVFEQ